MRKEEIPTQLASYDNKSSSVAASTKRYSSASIRQMPVSEPFPVAPVPLHIQLTPIVQPVTFVPYSSQEQPLLTFDGPEGGAGAMAGYADAGSNDYNAYYDGYNYAAQTDKKRKKGGTSLLLILFSLITLAVLIIGQFVEAVVDYTAVMVLNEEKVTAYKLVTDLFLKDFEFSALFSTDTNILTLGLAVTAVFAALTFLLSLFNFGSGGAPLATKLTSLLTFAGAGFYFAYAMVKKVELGIGAYIILGVSLVMAILVFAVKRYKPKKIKG
ncbi:MAG: hypothetical protein LBF12_01250 [Christensenellaceae bacterium]|jgi:hypothetical protein|nr:hypothetical protein [Christensenellaceae bacterium]